MFRNFRDWVINRTIDIILFTQNIIISVGIYMKVINCYEVILIGPGDLGFVCKLFTKIKKNEKEYVLSFPGSIHPEIYEGLNFESFKEKFKDNNESFTIIDFVKITKGSHASFPDRKRIYYDSQLINNYRDDFD